MRASDQSIAAIDLGTNTVLMLVARLDRQGQLEVIEDHCEGPRLGAGLAATGSLAESAVERTLNVLTGYAGRLRELGIPLERCRVVSTAVLRRAADAPAFIQRVREVTGFEVEILPEETEARLGYLAVTGEGGSADTLIVDVGGGSTEIVGDSGKVRLSVPVGAVVLTETFLGDADTPPLKAGGWQALVEFVAESVQRFPESLAAPPDESTPDVVCLGGTPSNLACLDLELEAFDIGPAEGHRFETPVARQLAERLSALDVAQRISLPIEPDRAPILPAGLLCLAATLERIGAVTARVSGRGLRYGVARDFLSGGPAENPT